MGGGVLCRLGVVARLAASWLGTTVLDLPEGIDLAEHPIVDVSVEPLDGDPTNSGVSVARGVLES